MIKETQKFLNYFIDADLVVDGIYGAMTAEAVKKALVKIKTKFSYEGFVYSRVFNFIGIRTSMKITNKFDDWFLITSKDTLIAMPASTKAGYPAIMKYANRWINGMRGFGTIVENQSIDYALIKPRLGNIWTMWSGGGGFLYQDKSIKVYRDNNTDLTINTDIISRKDINNGFNVHSWKNYAYSLVNNLSEGCQVCQAKYWKFLFKQFTKYATADKRITYTLLMW